MVGHLEGEDEVEIFKGEVATKVQNEMFRKTDRRRNTRCRAVRPGY
jgi:hypothetical protein